MGRRKKSRHATPNDQQAPRQGSSQGPSTSTPAGLNESNQAGTSQAAQEGNQTPTQSSQRGHGRGSTASTSFSPSEFNGPTTSVRGRGRGRGRGNIARSPQPCPSTSSSEHEPQSAHLNLGEADFPALGQHRSKQRSIPHTEEVGQQLEQLQVQVQEVVPSVVESQGDTSMQMPYQVPYPEQVAFQQQMVPSPHFEYQQQFSPQPVQYQQVPYQQMQQYQVFAAQQGQYQVTTPPQLQHRIQQGTQQLQFQQIPAQEQMQFQQMPAQEQMQYQPMPVHEQMQFQHMPAQDQIQYQQMQGSPQYAAPPQLHLITSQEQLPYHQMFAPLQHTQSTSQEQLPYQLFTPPLQEQQQRPLQMLMFTPPETPPFHMSQQQVPYHQVITPLQNQQDQYQQQQIQMEQIVSPPPQNVVPTTPTPSSEVAPDDQEVTVTPQEEEKALPDAVGTAKVVDAVQANFRQGGSQGRKIQVLTNHFPLHLSPKITTAYQYDVTIEPDRPKKLLPVVMQQMQKIYYPNNHPAYDGMKNLISAYELPEPLPITGTIKITEDGREKEYNVKIQLASVVDLTVLTRFFNQKFENQMVPPMHVLQCLDIVLRSRPSTTMITAGRSYFSVPDQIVKLGNGMEMYRGFYQSAILGWKPFLNVDVSHKAFPSAMSILDLIKDIDSKADLALPLSRYVEHKLSKYICNLKIEYIMPNKPMSKRTYRALNIEKSASNYMFTNNKGKQLSVAQYFKEEKKYTLKYPHLPCLWVGSKLRNAKVVLPCELCSVVSGQVTNQKMDELQTRNMIKSATTSTSVRKNHITSSLKVANHNDSPVMKEFGLSIDSQMTEVTARVLEPPKIKYYNCLQPVVRGAWKGGQFFTTVALNKWAILCLDGRIPDTQINEFKESFIRQGKLWKMSINANVRVNRLDLDRIPEDNVYNAMYHQFSQYQSDKMQLIVVVLNDRRSDTYANVKKIAELDTGCLTQCMRGNTIFRLALRTIDNLLQKANAKLNGINHLWHERPAAMNRPVIIMGADVTHPSPDAKDATPSVAAVTASQDPQAAIYNIIWRLQDPRAEIITDLEAITRRQLIKFYDVTSHKPEKIIFYRDGVSDGQFDEVRKKEIQAVRNACSSLNSNYKPAITFLVVQKRHHTRLFPVRSTDSQDQNGNVPAGTVVDTHITHPITQDFYLVSHSSGQGVARPTKYRTLWDDSDMSDDNIEQLTFYLCHMFIRCNKSVSYPAPTFYAHLAAARAKVYFEDRPWKDFKDLNKLQEQVKTLDEIQIDHPMFFV